MSKRLVKQFLYGIFFLAVFSAIGYGLYAVTIKPAPSCFDNKQNGTETGVDCGGNCISCEAKNLKSLSVSSANLYGSDRAYSAAATVKNPNTSFAIKSFDYQFDFYNASDQVLKSIKGKSFLYAGEEKIMAEAGVVIANGIPLRVKLLVFPESLVLEKASEFSQPPVDGPKDIAAALADNQVLVSGNITNPASFSISKVFIGAFAVDSLGKKLAVSKTELMDLEPFRVRNFQLIIPVLKSLQGNLDLEATGKSVFVEILK